MGETIIGVHTIMDMEEKNIFLGSLSKLSQLNRDGNYHEAIKRGLLLYLLSHSDSDDTQDSMALVYVQTAIEKLLQTLTEKSPTDEPTRCCSFCGQSPPKVRLGAGPNAFICNECVDTFYEIFKK
jgi:hypothetical protein